MEDPRLLFIDPLRKTLEVFLVLQGKQPRVSLSEKAGRWAHNSGKPYPRLLPPSAFFFLVTDLESELVHHNEKVVAQSYRHLSNAIFGRLSIFDLGMSEGRKKNEVLHDRRPEGILARGVDASGVDKGE